MARAVRYLLMMLLMCVFHTLFVYFAQLALATSQLRDLSRQRHNVYMEKEHIEREEIKKVRIAGVVGRHKSTDWNLSMMTWSIWKTNYPSTYLPHNSKKIHRLGSKLSS